MKQGLEEILTQRVLVLDGSMGTQIQRLGLNEASFRGQRFADWPLPLCGNNDLLSITFPDAIRKIHRDYLEAGADIIETNTFNAQSISQSEYGLQATVDEMNFAAAQLAREEADRMTRLTSDRPRFVAGSVGPTGKTASMSQNIETPAARSITFDELKQAYGTQLRALIRGGIDLVLIETAFDTLNVKAALQATAEVFDENGSALPTIVSLTIADTSGRMLTGQSIEAFLATIAFAAPLAVGINCSFGPAQLRPFLKQLSQSSPFYTCAYPNAGLPDAMGEYSESAESMASYLRMALDEGLLNIVGGCCGSTPAHIAALAKAVAASGIVRKRPEKQLGWLSGLDAFTPQPGVFVNIGERCNVAGSKKFLRLIKEQKYDEALDIARGQVADGAMIIDLNMDDGLLDSKKEMVHFVNLLASDPEVARIPWMIDSSKFEVIEAALKCIPGKAVVNSISLKEGEAEFLRRAQLLKGYGAAVVVMAFDEEGQAVTFDRKIAICKRAYRLLTEQTGMATTDIIFDPNVLTVATGMAEHRRYAIDFIEATRWIHAHLSGAKVSGGISNLSFAFRGNNYLREAMHAVFLYHAIAAGLDMAILNPASRVMYDDLPTDLLTALEDVVLCRRDDADERLVDIAAHYVDKKVVEQHREVDSEDRSIEEKLIYALRFGETKHLEEDLAAAMKVYDSPQSIIDGPLMDSMTVVGDLFGQGKMFLPQVVKSARTMKAAVEILSPYIREEKKTENKSLGKFVIATVKGDVHDIGKNITGVVLGCNNFDVTDLGVMVETERIVEAVLREQPDFLGLSGLITPSLDEMCRVAEELAKVGITIPLFIGGATTSALHTAVKIAPLYKGPVLYAKDASQTALLAHKLLGADREAFLQAHRTEQQRQRDAYRQKTKETTETILPTTQKQIKIDWKHESLAPPSFVGTRIIQTIPIAEVRPYISWTQFRNLWRVRKNSAEANRIQAEAEEVLNILTREGMSLTAIIGFFEAYRDSETIVIRTTDNCCATCGQSIVIPTPRQKRPGKTGFHLSLCDFIAPEGYHDHIGCFGLTLSRNLIDWLERLKHQDDAYASLLLQGLCDRLVEAGSEWLHLQVRLRFWGYAPDENLSMKQLYAAVYRGIRPAVGYPSLPDQQQIFKIDRLLKLDTIGIRLTENGAMYPQASTCGLYLASPYATYFAV